MKLDLTAVTLDGVGLALEKLLGSGIARSKDTSSDPVIFRDSYYAELKGLPIGALELAVEEVQRRAPKWLPTAGELAALTRTLIPKSRAHAPLPEIRQIERVRGFDPLGPLTRDFPAGQAEDHPLPTEAICPDGSCACRAEFVWAQAALFGAQSTAWGARWVWAHVARAHGLKQTTEWNPYKP